MGILTNNQIKFPDLQAQPGCAQVNTTTSRQWYFPASVQTHAVHGLSPTSTHSQMMPNVSHRSQFFLLLSPSIK